MIQEEKKTRKQSSWGVRRILGIIIAILCIVGITYSVVSKGEDIYKKIHEEKQEEIAKMDYPQYLDKFMMSGYQIYLPIEMERQGKDLQPEEIYLKTEARINEATTEDEVTKEQSSIEQEANVDSTMSETMDELVVENSYEEDLDYDVNGVYIGEPEVFPQEKSDNYYDTSELYERIYLGTHLTESNAISYLMQDNQTGYQVSHDAGEVFTNSVQKRTIEQKLKDQYPVVLLIQYDSEGNTKILDCYGVKKTQAELNLSSIGLSNLYPGRETTEIQDVTFLLAIHEDGLEKLNEYYGYYSNEKWEFIDQRFIYTVLIASVVVLFLAALLMVLRLAGVDDELITRMPIELTGTATVLLMFGYFLMSELTYHVFNGDIIEVIQEFGQIIAMDLSTSYELIGTLFLYGIWFLYLGLIFIFCVALFQVIRKGPMRFLKENCIIFTVIRWIVRKMKQGYQNIINFDFDDNVNRVVLKLVGINAIIIAIMCSIWFFGWGVLLVYSIILFILLRNYLRNAQMDYQKILSATKEMAKGNLKVEIRDHLGIFEPLKEELLQVKEGFSRAVEEEVKSQNMRNELITNVSHDLKTPLTAIITYVELLKDESINIEQSREYITTLDQKAQRLKHLIEDLFEVSKLNSNNVQLQVVDVDLVALLKQVQFEYEEKFEEQSIALISRLPQEKIMMKLDSQKTYRIFENLFGNIVKYAMTNTRAYVEINKEESQVTISLKNISQHIIDLEGEMLAERFVRGDQSRNTEGSGLGLAIVKSLVEKQGGTIQIIVDGDLFKIIIQFPSTLFAESKPDESKETIMEESDEVGQKVNVVADDKETTWMTDSFDIIIEGQSQKGDSELKSKELNESNAEEYSELKPEESNE